MRTQLQPTEADKQIRAAIDAKQSFAVRAGAGAGKTTSLVETLKYIRRTSGRRLRQNGQQIVCITYTKRAVAVISEKVEFDQLFHISTIHSFLWGVIGRFQQDIREALRSKVLPHLIEKAGEKDNGRQSKDALKARAKVKELTEQLQHLDAVVDFRYDDSGSYSDFSTGQIGHDDMVRLATSLILGKPLLRRILGARFPYIFVDEAQDTFDSIVAAFNSVCVEDGLPLVGYFGDPMQQIYGNGTGEFWNSEGIVQITKEENFRSAKAVVDFLNVFRTDIQQIASGELADVEGSVRMMLIQADNPEGSRKSYTPEQLDRALDRFDSTLKQWEWENNSKTKQLFLVRRMIARRLKFLNLQLLFTGNYASTKAKNGYEKGEHFLLKPFISTLCPLIKASIQDDQRTIIEILSRLSPAFKPTGDNSQKTLKEMLVMADSIIAGLNTQWKQRTSKDVLLFAKEKSLCKFSPQLISQLEREPRTEEYDDELHALEKGDWLSDKFFEMSADELIPYSDFVQDNTPFSTQHGSKGEQYKDVLVVFDDVEAAWTNYNFTKLLTPTTSGEASDGQREKSRKLAYVCFSRAEVNLRIIMFTSDPDSARGELVSSGLLKNEQIDTLRHK